MLLLVTPDRYGSFVDELAQMHALRHRVFRGRLDWDVETVGGMEIDSFDALQPTYILLRRHESGILGCVRLLSTLGSNMLRDAFPMLLHGGTAPASSRIWESSRFALDGGLEMGQGSQGIAGLTYELFAGMVEFGLAHNLSRIVTVTDVRIERILRRAQWPLERIGAPMAIGNTKAVAGYLEISSSALSRLRQGGQLSGPVLWVPVMCDAA